MVDRRHDTLYDRVRLRAGSIVPPLMHCFNVPVGRNKGFEDTNMWQASQLPAPHDMVVERFLFLFQPGALDIDRNAFLSRYIWRFKILEKYVETEPVLICAAEGRPEMLVENFGKGTWLEDKSPRENDSTSSLRKLGEGVCWDLCFKGTDLRKYLPPLVTFDVELHGAPFELQGDLDFYVMMEGQRDWPVQ